MVDIENVRCIYYGESISDTWQYYVIVSISIEIYCMEFEFTW